MQVNSILIVGGGTAGWFTAAALRVHMPHLNVTLVESPNIPTVGVGESTIGHINVFFHGLGMNITGEESWMTACDATYKASIKFTDFHKLGGEPYHYPFGRMDTDNLDVTGRDSWMMKKWIYPDLPNSDFVNSFYPQMPLIYGNKIYNNFEGTHVLNPYSGLQDLAYQIDATKLGLWLKGAMCADVTHIKDDVVDVSLDDKGYVSGVTTTDHGELTADLYIDCTGFKSLLLEGAMKEKFYDWSEDLPNNKAWATHKPYKDKEKEMEVWTNNTGIENGWVWNIPLWNNIGTGYVYCDSFVDDDTALAEFQRHIGHGDELDYKNIKIKTGRHKRGWVKNVCAIGLSNGFIEPLESSGLVLVTEPIDLLIKTLTMRDGKVTQYDRDAWCLVQRELTDAWKYFVMMHFYLTERDDTPYWNYWSQEKEMGAHWWGTDFEQPEFWPSGLVATGSFGMNNTYDVGIELAMCRLKAEGLRYLSNAYLCIAIGSGWFITNDYTVKKTRMVQPQFDKDWVDNKMKSTWLYWKNRTEEVQDIANTAPTMYEYLSKNIHK